MSLSKCSTTSCVSSLPLSEANDATRMSAPSSRRTLVRMRLARKSKISSRSLICKRARFLAQNRHARFDVRRLQLGGQAPFEARNEPMLEVGDFRRRPIAREHDLFMPVEESVEGVEKFFLRTFFAAEELDVVDQKQIGLAITFPEFDQVVVLDRVDELVDEQLAREIHHFGVLLFRPDVLADRLHQMRLAQSDAAVNEKRVVGLRRRLRDGETGGVRDLVVRPDHERFKSVARIESERAAALRFASRLVSAAAPSTALD